MCQAFDIRFYDLSRDPIICPSCGVRYVPEAPEMHAGMFTDKTGWRRKAFKRPDPEPDAADTAANDNVTEGANEDAPDPVSDEDVVLDEQEQDEADVTAFVDHHDAEPNER
ncbi:MAG TPA: FYDLN acid domain-containing protein [Hyphomicrobiaceae bacterium]|nr:FYDLN acid domain-containing protein [Hyphomicrobiaceae bacterium]